MGFRLTEGEGNDTTEPARGGSAYRCGAVIVNKVYRMARSTTTTRT